MVDLNSLVVDGCQPFDEGLLDEADMSEILGGNKDVYIYNESKCCLLYTSDAADE